MAVPNRLFVSIAVSSPQDLAQLPGAIDAAEKMAAWASKHGYATLLVHDGAGEQVTVGLLESKMTQAITQVRDDSGGPLQRLVIFFAGHGAVSPVGQCWMLSRWKRNPNEAINVNSLQRMLQFYGPIQVAVIGDACQEFSDTFKDVLGSAILEQPDEDEQDYELDRFFAVGTGKQAFMIPALGNEPAYCLYSKVLLDALAGQEADAFENNGDDHRITSQSLALYLRDAVPKAAGKHGLTMKPRSEPGFYTDKVYLGLRAPLAPPLPPAPPPGPEPVGAEPPEKIHLEMVDAALASRNHRLNFVKDRLERARVPNHFETQCGIAVNGAQVETVAVSRGAVSVVEAVPNWFRLDLQGAPDPIAWSDALVTLDSGQVYSVCAVQGFVAALTIVDDDTVSLFHRPNGEDSWADFEAIELLAKAHAGLLSERAIINTAAALRNEKHRFITLGCVAAQFYDAIRDVRSLRSMAHFYAKRRQPVPLDIILFGGGMLSEVNGQLMASIPAVPAREPRSDAEANRRFTFEATSAVESYPVAGRVPWMRQAWSAVATVRADSSLKQWRAQAMAAIPYLSAGDFTNVVRDGKQALADLAGIDLMRHEPEPLRQRYFAAGG